MYILPKEQSEWTIKKIFVFVLTLGLLIAALMGPVRAMAIDPYDYCGENGNLWRHDFDEESERQENEIEECTNGCIPPSIYGVAACRPSGGGGGGGNSCTCDPSCYSDEYCDSSSCVCRDIPAPVPPSCGYNKNTCNDGDNESSSLVSSGERSTEYYWRCSNVSEGCKLKKAIWLRAYIEHTDGAIEEYTDGAIMTGIERWGGAGEWLDFGGPHSQNNGWPSPMRAPFYVNSEGGGIFNPAPNMDGTRVSYSGGNISPHIGWL